MTTTLIDTPPHRTAGLPQAVLLIIGSCLPVMAAVLIAPVLPRIQAAFPDVANVAILVPVMLTAPSLFLALLAPFAGAIVDKLGRKRLLMGSLLLYGFAGTAPLWLQSLHAIIASRALLGVAESGVMICCTTLVGDCFQGKTRERLLTLQTVTASIAATLFFAFGGALGEISWRAPFLLYLVGFVLLPFAAVLLWEPLRRATAAQAVPVDTTPFPVAAVVALCATTLLSAVAFYLVPVHLSFVLDALGEHSPNRIGQAIAISSIATVVGAAGYSVLQRLGLALYLGLCYAVMGAGFLWLANAGDYVTVVAAASLASLGSGGVIPALVNAMMQRVNATQRGRGIGAFMASFFAGQFVCPVVVIVLGMATGRGLMGAIGALGWLMVALVIGAVVISRRPAAPPVLSSR